MFLPQQTSPVHSATDGRQPGSLNQDRGNSGGHPIQTAKGPESHGRELIFLAKTSAVTPVQLQSNYGEAGLILGDRDATVSPE